MGHQKQMNSLILRKSGKEIVSVKNPYVNFIFEVHDGGERDVHFGEVE